MPIESPQETYSRGKPAILAMFKLSALGWWRLLNDFLLPITYILAGALLYAEFDSIFATNPQSAKDVFVSIGGDIMSHPYLFGAFIIVLLLWVITKLRKDPMEKRLDNLVEKMDTNFKVLNDKIEALIQRGEGDGDKPKTEL